MAVFKNKYAELRSGWALALSVIVVLGLQMVLGIVVSVAATLQVGLEAVMNDTERYLQVIVDMTNAPLTTVILYSAMIGLLLLLFWLLYKRPLKQMGFYAKGWAMHLLYGGLFGVAAFSLAVVILLVSGAAKLTGLDFSNAAAALFWIGLVKYLYVGFFEEILSRGFMMTALKTTRNKWLIVLLPSVIFGLLHIMNAHVTFFSLANIALVGVLFSYLFIKTGRLWVPIGFHITWNFVQGFIFGVPVSGSEVPHRALTQTVFTGPDWLTGGAFGVEGGLACTVVLVLGLLFTHFVVKKPDKPEAFWSMDSDMPLTRGNKDSGDRAEVMEQNVKI